MRKLIPLLTLVFIFAAGRAQDTIRLNIYFASGSPKLGEQAKKKIDSFSVAINKLKITKITLNGHADDVGSAGSNMQLSEDRITSVYREMFLADAPFDAPLHMEPLGENEPISMDKTKAARAMNRRVEIVVAYEASTKAVSAPKELTGITINELFDRMTPAPQKFCINNSRDTVLVAKHGTLIYIKANSIDMLPGYTCDPCITVEVKEAFEKSDIVKEELTTVSGNDILVSQSMVYVGFKCDKASLPLKPGRDYVVFAPTDSLVDEAGIFQGDWDGTDGNMNWTPDTKAITQNIPARVIVACNDGHALGDVVQPSTSSCNGCRLFFCGIGKWMGGWFSKAGRQRSKAYFSCRKTGRKKRSSIPFNKTKVFELYSNNGVPASRGDTAFQWKCDTITDACGRKVCVSRSLGVRDSLLTKKKIQESIENIRKNGNPGVKDLNDLQFYAYTSNKPGWTNIDWMTKYPDSYLKTITINLRPTAYTDCKLIFINRRTVLPPQRQDDRFTYRLIPKDEPAYLLMIDTRTGTNRIKVELRNFVTGRITIDPVFTEMSLEEFAALLMKVNLN